MDENTLIRGITYAALGGVVLAGVGWFFVAMLRQSIARIGKDGTLDDRVMGMLTAMQKAYEQQQAAADTAYREVIKVQADTIVALRERTDKYQVELTAAYDRIALMQDTHQQTITATVAKVREEHKEATVRLHDRLDKAEEMHKECERKLGQQGMKIEIMERMLTPAAVSPVSLSIGAGVQLSPSPAPVSAPV